MNTLSIVVITICVSVSFGFIFHAWTSEVSLTCCPEPDGVCGPHRINGEFFYLVPEGLWVKAKLKEAIAMGIILYNDEQIEDARKGIEADLAKLIGYFIRVDLVPGTNHIQFIARGAGSPNVEAFNTIVRQNLSRVEGLKYDLEAND